VTDGPLSFDPRTRPERAAKKWEPVFRKKRAKSGNLEASAIRPNR